jgi:hypothetical protein
MQTQVLKTVFGVSLGQKRPLQLNTVAVRTLTVLTMLTIFVEPVKPI